MTKSETIVAALRALDHVPRVDSDGDVFVEINGETYVCYAEESDQEFLRISVRVGKLRDQSQYWPTLAAINDLNLNVKVAKAWLTPEGGISLGVEAVIASPAEIPQALELYLFYLDHGITRVRQALAAIP